jgi:leucyl-tRNA synthetase
VSVARLMELLNRIKDIKTEGDKVLRLQMEKLMYSYLIQALYPVAPHLTSEIWE